MQDLETLRNGGYYHIYNHATGKRDLFCEPDNYEYFLHLYDKHISPVAETYVWVLMKNHYHFASNRTTLELKSGARGFCSSLWGASNRTTLELKPPISWAKVVPADF